ncbi:hypothetical protein J7E62_17765 [Variovorax paradoxus]|nr:hypothetical protein [Variovorax paradoxus]
MRIVGLIGLVLALLIVGLLVKKQMGGVAGAPAANPHAQSQQIQQQFKQSLDAAMQQPRPVADDN